MASILDEVLPSFSEIIMIPRTTSQDLNEKGISLAFFTSVLNVYPQTGYKHTSHSSLSLL